MEHDSLLKGFRKRSDIDSKESHLFVVNEIIIVNFYILNI